jgi:mannuronan synthase
MAAAGQFSLFERVARPAKWTLRTFAGIAIYIAVCAALLSMLPTHVWLHEGRAFFGVLGLFGVWRYGWWLTHVIRSEYYARRAYPALARTALANWDNGWRPRKLHVLVTVYRERAETIEAVMAAICREVRATKMPATIWIGTKEAADEETVARCLARAGSDLDIHLRVVRQTGSGKRNSIALILSAMAREGLTADDFVAFMDSDFILSPGALKKCLPLFASDPQLQALTTDEDCVVHGPRWVQTWLDMRFAQRRLAMQSHALSGRVLTLTGRFSVFRGTHIVQPDFIGLVAEDMLDHWLWGRFRFLSGDDKSTWYALLRLGARMLYVPDAHGITIEVFEGSAVRRMLENLRRWSGNMLRNGSRAIALGPRRMPLFIWWCLVDQRLAMWTMLFGPLCAVAGIMKLGWMFLVAYAVYVALTRLVSALVLFTYSRHVDLNYTWALYANQLSNSAVKLYMIWRLPKQRWFNRGNQTSGAGGGFLLATARSTMAAYLTGLSVVMLVLVALLLTNTLAMPNLAIARRLAGDMMRGWL